MKRTKPAWVRTRTASELTLYHFPFVGIWVAQQERAWTYRIRVGNEGVALGEAATQRDAERRGIEKLKQMLQEIERACP
jgi:hypothetical protein